MKIILSHDVDHWKWSEHLFDGFALKFMVRNMYYGVTTKVPLKLAMQRIFSIPKGNIAQLDALLAFEKEMGVSSTIFVGVENGLGLSYSKTTAQQIINLVKKYEFKLGVHGIAFDSLKKIKIEKEQFEKLSGETNIGIRTHYLRMSERTHSYMEKAGYCFDSTVSGINPASHSKGFAVFPISIMDVDVLSPASNNLDSIKKKTLNLINQAKLNKLNYFVVNFHDNYFSDLYPDHKAWYAWVVQYLKQEGYEFTDFYKAQDEMELNG